MFSAAVAAVMAMTGLTAKAQTDIVLTQHWAIPTLYNPARTGETDFLRIRGAARLQWIGVENAPKSFSGAADMPFNAGKGRIGTGVTVNQESIGLFSNLLAAAQGCYRLKTLGGTFSAGIQVGYLNTRFRGSDIYIPDDDGYHKPDDPALPDRDLSGNAIDLSAGVSYIHRSFHVGLAAAHITSPGISLSAEGSESAAPMQFESKLRATFYFDAGGNIPLKNTLFQLQPSLLAAADAESFSAIMSMRAVFNRFLSFGIGYRWNDAVSVMAGASFKNFFIGYSFDYSTSAIAGASSGSHEIVAGYQIKLDLSGKNKHRHRSVRIM